MENLNITRKIIGALAVIVMMSGCSRDEGPGDDDRQVRFTATVGGSQTVGRAVPSGDPSPNTRTTAGGNEWAANDEVGIYMISSGQGMPAGIVDGYDNMRFNPVTGNSATSDLFPADGQPVYWPPTGSYDFAAYYPFGEKGNNDWQVDNDYNLNISVAEQSDPEAIDVLYAKATNKSKGETVAFTFNHVLAKVRVNITAGDGIKPSDLTGMTATLLDLPTTAKLSLSDGSLSGEDDVEDLLMPEITATGFEASFEAIVLPAAAGGKAMEFTFTGRDSHYWSIPAGHAIPAGKVRIYNLTVSAEGLKLTGSAITAWDEVDSGTGELLDAIPLPEANCYMVTPGGAPILIPVSQANKAAETEYNLGAVATGLGGVEAGNFTVELVWGDTPVATGKVVEDIQPYGEYVYVKPGPTAGNMVIAIKDKDSGNIKWSWHIWVTEPVTSATDTKTDLTWMDRNLGAGGAGTWQSDGKNGLFYQWGRKDAFPGGDGSYGNQTYYTPADQSGTTANIPTGDHTQLPTMVQNPMSFANNDITYYGSINEAGAGNKSWSGNAGEKTLYDPCPPGWKVPPITISTQNVWGFAADWGSFTNFGRIFDGVGRTANLGHYYPASDLRRPDTGLLGNQGTGGYYWSATTDTSSNGGYYLAFNSGSVNPARSSSRTYGFSVRCVAEPSLP